MATKTEPLRFKAFLNQDKTPGDTRPLLVGEISFPGVEGERPLSLWTNVSQKGAQYFSGTMKKDPAIAMEPKDQLSYYAQPQTGPQTDYTIKVTMEDGKPPRVYKPNEIVLYENPGHAENPKQPTHFGYANPGNGMPLQSIGAWMGKDRNGDLMLTGNVQEWEPRKEKEAEGQRMRTDAHEPEDHRDEDELEHAR